MDVWNDNGLSSYVPVFYETNDFWFVRKPHGIASSYGKQYSFLDYLYDNVLSLPQVLQSHVTQGLDRFGRDAELGLVNRLDTVTGGLLYFAKDAPTFSRYKKQQAAGLIYKYYCADVQGERRTDFRIIGLPLYHHKYEHDRMVVYRGNKDKNRVRGKKHLPLTACELLSTNEGSSRLLVSIQQGVRHQIRAHLSGIGYPILGDVLYGGPKGEKDKKISLRSVGVCHMSV